MLSAGILATPDFRQTGHKSVRLIVCVDFEDVSSVTEAYRNLHGVMEQCPFGWETSEEAYCDGEEVQKVDLGLAIDTFFAERDGDSDHL